MGLRLDRCTDNTEKTSVGRKAYFLSKKTLKTDTDLGADYMEKSQPGLKFPHVFGPLKQTYCALIYKVILSGEKRG